MLMPKVSIQLQDLQVPSNDFLDVLKNNPNSWAITNYNITSDPAYMSVNCDLGIKFFNPKVFNDFFVELKQKVDHYNNPVSYGYIAEPYITASPSGESSSSAEESYVPGQHYVNDFGEE